MRLPRGRTWWPQLLLAVGFLLVASCSSPDWTRRQKSLLSDDRTERIVAASRYRSSPEGAVDELLEILRQPGIDRTHGGSLHLAILLLGELRDPEAVGPLVEHLTFVPDLDGGLWVQKEDLPVEAYHVAPTPGLSEARVVLGLRPVEDPR